METPSTPGGADHGVQGLVDPPAGVEQGGEEGSGAQLGDGELDLPGGGGHGLGPRAVAAVGALRRALVAPRADHGGGPEPRPGPCGPARGQTPEDARLARSGSARTSRISVDTADWFVAGIVGALLVNLGRRTGLPRCPPPSRAGGPPRRRGPAGIATTLRDAPDCRDVRAAAPLDRDARTKCLIVHMLSCRMMNEGLREYTGRTRPGSHEGAQWRQINHDREDGRRG